MGLWRSLPVILVFEAFFFVTGLWLYLRTTRPKTESAIMQRKVLREMPDGRAASYHLMPHVVT
jgi:hypothetical protein